MLSWAKTKGKKGNAVGKAKTKRGIRREGSPVEVSLCVRVRVHTHTDERERERERARGV